MKNNKESNKLFLSIISNRKLFWSFLSLTGITLLIFITSFWIISEFITKRADKIKIMDTGTIIIEIDNDTDAASFLLSSNGGGSCTPWINTGIEICKGDRITFKFSGKICVGVHRMIESAIKNTELPPIPWSTAEGIDSELCNPKRAIRSLESTRKKCLIAEDFPVGRLIGVICSTTRPKHRPDSIIDIPSFTNSSFEAKNSGKLWLTINENWLDLETLNKYDFNQLGMSENEYNFIKEKEYCNVWYDDNSGFFNVTIEIDR